MLEKSKPFLLSALRSILFVISGLILVLITNKSFEQSARWWSIVASICNVITIIVLILVCKSEKRNFKDLINYKKGQAKIKVISIGIVLTLIIGMGGMYLSGLLVYGKFPYMDITMVQPLPIWIIILNALILPITTTLAEDGIYLGYSLNKIKNKWLCVLVPATFYALQHSFIPFIADWKFIVYRVLSFLPLTIIFAIWYYKKRNIIPIMAGHFVINLSTVSMIIMTSVSPGMFEMMKLASS